MKANSNSSKITFGTDGWRGIIADDFTFSNVRKVTRAIASYIETAYTKNRPVLVAYDTRFLAEQFALTAAEVLADLGWTVVKITKRDCPTPVIAYNARHLNSAGALMFTASHNPAPYCGIKYIPDYAGPATLEITDTIVANLESASNAPPSQNSTVGSISSFDPKPDYINFLYSLLDVEKIPNARLKVKYDALYSTSCGYLDEVLQHCHCELENFHTWRDVLFGGGMPEPMEEQLQQLVEAVRRDKADLGLATDGDGDRFAVIDEQGKVLTPNSVLLVLTLHLMKNKHQTGAIFRTVATTHLLDNLAAKYGLQLLETPVGFKYIGGKMRQTQVLIGGEESGGLSISGHIPEKDGILVNMLVAEARLPPVRPANAWEGKPLSVLVKEAIASAGGPRYERRLDLHLAPPHKIAILHSYSKNPPSKVAGIRVTQIGTKDGVKLYLEEGSWVLLRPSGTEPLMRVYIETNSPEKLTQIASAIQQAIHQLQPVSA